MNAFRAKDAPSAVRIMGRCAFSPLDRREWRAALGAMLAAARACPCAEPPQVVLYLLNDARMARANARHMGCPGPTNILSFPGGTDSPGELLLSLDTLRRECLLYGQDGRRHAVRLLAHGMGHLCGLDHGPEMEALSDIFMRAAHAAGLDGPARGVPPASDSASP